MEICRLCSGSDLIEIGIRQLLKRHSVRYFECKRCGYRQAEKPWWLDEAYANPINSCDTGVLQRTLACSRFTKALVILTGGQAEKKFLDFGGGYGIFVRHMRDCGLDFRWADHYCRNLLAAGFDSGPEEQGFAIATCFEVMEHLEFPLLTMKNLLVRADAVFFSTELAPESLDDFWAWPYIGSEHGQHIGFMSSRTLRWMACDLKVHLRTNGRNLHLFSKNRVSGWRWRLSTYQRTAQILNSLVRYDSRTMHDNARMRNAASESNKQTLSDGGT